MTDKNPPPAYDPNFSMTDSTPASWTHVNQPLPGQVEVVNVDVNQVEVVQVEAVQVVFKQPVPTTFGRNPITTVCHHCDQLVSYAINTNFFHCKL